MKRHHMRKSPRFLDLLAPLAVLLMSAPATALAHGVTAGDKGYIQETFGTRIIPFMYLMDRAMYRSYLRRTGNPPARRSWRRP